MTGAGPAICQFCGATLVFRGQTSCQSCGRALSSAASPGLSITPRAAESADAPAAEPSAASPLPAATPLPPVTSLRVSAPAGSTPAGHGSTPAGHGSTPAGQAPAAAPQTPSPAETAPPMAAGLGPRLTISIDPARPGHAASGHTVTPGHAAPPPGHAPGFAQSGPPPWTNRQPGPTPEVPPVWPRQPTPGYRAQPPQWRRSRGNSGSGGPGANTAISVVVGGFLLVVGVMALISMFTSQPSDNFPGYGFPDTTFTYGGRSADHRGDADRDGGAAGPVAGYRSPDPDEPDDPSASASHGHAAQRRARPDRRGYGRERAPDRLG